MTYNFEDENGQRVELTQEQIHALVLGSIQEVLCSGAAGRHLWPQDHAAYGMLRQIEIEAAAAVQPEEERT
jgi:hypothetical protein